MLSTPFDLIFIFDKRSQHDELCVYHTLWDDYMMHMAQFGAIALVPLVP
jgi:hypothetical protein